MKLCHLLVGFSLFAFSAVAGPLDVFVRDEKLFSAQTIRCPFPVATGANWDDGEPIVKSFKRDNKFLLLFDSIGEKKARLIGNAGSEDVLVIRTDMGLTFIEKTPSGSWNTTTVFVYREKDLRGRFTAVTSRHLNFTFKPYTSQSYGKCKVLEYYQ